MKGVVFTHNACYVNFLEITSKTEKPTFQLTFRGKFDRIRAMEDKEKRFLEIVRRELAAWWKKDPEDFQCELSIGRRFTDDALVLNVNSEAIKGYIASGATFDKLVETWERLTFNVWDVESLEELDMKLAIMGY